METLHDKQQREIRESDLKILIKGYERQHELQRKRIRELEEQLKRQVACAVDMSNKRVVAENKLSRIRDKLEKLDCQVDNAEDHLSRRITLEIIDKERT